MEMKRLNLTTMEEEENKQVDAFIEDLIKVYKKHGMMVTQELIGSETIVVVVQELTDEAAEETKQAAFWFDDKEALACIGAH